MAYMGPAFNTFDVNFNFDDLVLDANDIAENGDLLQYDVANAQWLTVSNLTIPGNLIVNGTTTTVNSTTITVDDPIFTLGGDTAPTSDDSKDRGIEFRWHDGANAKVGFFGFDNGTGQLTYIPDATNTGEVFSGTPGSVLFSDATFSGNTAIKIPVGGTADRPSALQGHMRYNTDTSQFEGYDGANWSGLGGIIDVDQDTYITAEETTDADTLKMYTGGSLAVTVGNDQNVSFDSTGAIVVPVGTTAERPGSLAQGMIRYNTDDSTFEGYDGGTWGSLGGVKDVDQDTYIEAEQSADDDTLRFYTAGVERMTIDGTGNINFNGGLELGLQATITGELTTTATTQVALDNWSITEYRTAKYMLQAVDTDSNEYHISELMVVHNGTSAFATEYGTIHTGTNPLASYDVDVNSNAVRLLATPASTNNTNFKFSRNALTPEPTFALGSSSASINEGDAVTFTLTTTQVSNGTAVPYTITGIQSADLSVGSLTGNFTVNNNTATNAFTLSADATTEGSETLTLALDNGQASSAVTIGDTSLDPTYTLSADNTTINEGASVVITLTTTDVPDATNVAYTVTGVDTDDLTAGSLTGNFAIASNTATATFTLAEDTTTEGDETLTLTLDNGSGNIAITITDSSTTPSSGGGQNLQITPALPANSGGLSTDFADDGRIATNGTYTVVGDPRMNIGTINQPGWAWIYKNSDGSEMASFNSILDGHAPNDSTLASKDGNGNYASSKYHKMYFGQRVAINDTYAFVTAPVQYSQYESNWGSGNESGGQYGNGNNAYVSVIRLSDMTHVRTIKMDTTIITNGASYAAGGTSWGNNGIAVTNDWLAIGAPHGDVNSVTNVGQIEVFNITDANPANWTSSIIDNTFSGSGNGNLYNFGYTVAIDGNKLAGSHMFALQTWSYNGSSWTAVANSQNAFPNQNNDVDNIFIANDKVYATRNTGSPNYNAFIEARNFSDLSLAWSQQITETNGYPGYNLIIDGDYIYTSDSGYTDANSNANAGRIMKYTLDNGTHVANYDTQSLAGQGAANNYYGATFDVASNWLISKEKDTSQNPDAEYLVFRNLTPASSGSGYSGGVANLNTYPTTAKPISYYGMHLAWNGDGTAFTWWYQYQNMEWWDVSTPWDLSTATKNATKSQTPNNILGGNNFLTFDYNADGTKMLVWSFDNPEPKAGIKEWNLSTAYDPNSHGGSPSTNASLNSATFAAGNPKAYNYYHHIHWVDSGNKIALTEQSTCATNLYSASSAYDLSSVDFTSPISSGPPDPTISGKVFWFSDDGLTAYTASGTKVKQCAMSSAWDLSTLTVVAEKELSDGGTNIVGGIDDIHVEPSENKIYLTCYGGVDQNGNAWNDATGTYQNTNAWIGEWEFTSQSGGSASADGFINFTTDWAVAAGTGTVNQSNTANVSLPANKITQAADKSYYVTGEVYSKGGWLTKYNESGAFQWAKEYGSYYLRSEDVVTDDANNVYVAGSDYGYGENLQAAGGTYDPQCLYIAKFNDAGARQWSKILRYNTISSSSHTTYTNQIEIDSYGNLWMVGSNSASVTGNSSQTVTLFKVDSSGALSGVWYLPSNVDTSNAPTDILVDGTDMYIGWTQYDTVYGAQGPHCVIAKMNIPGATGSPTYTWVKEYGMGSGGTHYDVGNMLAKTSDGNLIVGGYTDNQGAGQDNYATLMKLDDTTGDFIWKKRYDQQFGKAMINMAVDGSDNIYFTGDTNNVGYTHYYLWMRKIDSSDGSTENVYELDFTGTASNGAAWRFETSHQRGLQVNRDGNLIMIISPNGNASGTYENTIIKFPSTITAGTFGQLIISESSTTGTDDTYGATDVNYASYSTVTSIGGQFQTTNYNSGTYNDTITTPTLTESLTVISSGGGGGSSSLAWGGSRGFLIAGSVNSVRSTNIEYLNIASPGNASNFGDLITATEAHTSGGNKTRGITNHGTISGSSYPAGWSAGLEYFTCATLGNASSFGNRANRTSVSYCVADGTKVIWAGGQGGTASGSYNNGNNFIDYVTADTTGDSVDFGDMTQAKHSGGSTNDDTRGVFISGLQQGAYTNVIDYITMATPGNAIDFGDLHNGDGSYAPSTGVVSDNNIGVFAGGMFDSTYTSTDAIMKITIQTPGNSSDFGDLVAAKERQGATTDGTTGIFANGYQNTPDNSIVQITIATPGNATDFGDTVANTNGQHSGMSGNAS